LGAAVADFSFEAFVVGLDEVDVLLLEHTFEGGVRTTRLVGPTAVELGVVLGLDVVVHDGLREGAVTEVVCLRTPLGQRLPWVRFLLDAHHIPLQDGLGSLQIQNVSALFYVHQLVHMAVGRVGILMKLVRVMQSV